jgi:hypothetical protein
MSTEMIVDAALRQFAAANETLSAWKPEDSALAEKVSYAENAIVLLLDRPTTMRRVVERIRQVATAEPARNLLELWHEGSSLFAAALRPVAGHRELIALLQKAGYAIDGADRFEQTIRELEEMRDEFRKTFPGVTQQQAAADRNAIAAGESQEIDEAFADIAGVDVDAWRKRVAGSPTRQMG